jgi:hypothetical protein
MWNSKCKLSQNFQNEYCLRFHGRINYYIYIKCWGIFLLVANWNKSMGNSDGAPLDTSITSCSQGIYAKQITTENIYEITSEHWHSHQWAWRLNCQLKMVYTISKYMARFITWSHCYIETRKISQNMDNLTVLILLKQPQSSLTTNQTESLCSE